MCSHEQTRCSAPRTHSKWVKQATKYNTCNANTMLVTAHAEDVEALILAAACSCRIRGLMPEILEKA